MNTTMTKIRERFRELEMPKPVCVVGSAIVPPLGVGLVMGIVWVLVYLVSFLFGFGEPDPMTRPTRRTEFDAWLRWAVLWTGPAIAGGAIWIALGLWSYIHCHEFWHDEKPQWAKSEYDLNIDFELDYMDCPECEEREPDKWHWIGKCAHFGTTP